MSKTGPEIRHDAKERMKKYRAEMTAKGYISTTVFLSQEHRAELKRLGNEYRLTRAEAAEHIFQTYLQSDNKGTTQTYNAVITSYSIHYTKLYEINCWRARKATATVWRSLARTGSVRCKR